MIEYTEKQLENRMTSDKKLVALPDSYTTNNLMEMIEEDENGSSVNQHGVADMSMVSSHNETKSQVNNDPNFA